MASCDVDISGVTRVRARQVGSAALVDVEVEVHPDLSASCVRAIEERTRVRIASGVEGILDVQVRATAEDAVFCPLLTQIEDSYREHHLSATEVEEEARALLHAHPDVVEVRGVTVHYQDTVRVRVDANICVNPNASVYQANRLAATLRKNLEDSDEIFRANIFLDLNEDAPINTRAPFIQAGVLGALGLLEVPARPLHSFPSLEKELSHHSGMF